MDQPFFFPAVIICIISLPLILALIPRNRFYGFRTEKTLSDDRIWYRVNRFGGWLLLISTAIYLAFALEWPMHGPRDPRFLLWLIHLGMFSVPLLTSVILTIRYVRKL